MVDCSNVLTYSYLELAMASGCGKKGRDGEQGENGFRMEKVYQLRMHVSSTCMSHRPGQDTLLYTF